MYNRENNCYDVTFIGQNVGTVVAEAKLGNYIARLTIEVTASLKLEASSTNISVYSGDTDTITLTVKDANDKQLLAETEKTLRWEIAVDNNGVQQDVIECSKDDIKLNADGTFSLPLTGLCRGRSHGEHHVHISVRRGNCRGARKRGHGYAVYQRYNKAK